MTTELNTANIFEKTQQVFQELSNDTDVINIELSTFTLPNILSIQGPCLQIILRLNRLILPETELNADERYEKLFKFILWYCIIGSPKAIAQNYTTGIGVVIRSIDELNVAYNFFNTTVLQSQRHQLLTHRRRTRPRPTSSPRSITDESSPQRRRMLLSIDTQLANASFNDNMNNDVGEDLEIQGITAGLPINSLSTQIVAETPPNQTQTNSSSLSNIIRNVEQLSPFAPIQIQQSEEVAASGQSRQPTPHPHTTSGLNLPSPGSPSSVPPTLQGSVNRPRRRRRFAMNLPSAANVREIIERGGIVPPSPDLSETETESFIRTVSTTSGGTSTTSATDIVASSQPSIGSPQQVQRTEQLSFDQLLNQIRLYNPEASSDFTSIIQSLTLFSRIMTNISNHEPGFIPTVSSESFVRYTTNALDIDQYNLPHAPPLMFMYLYVLLRILNDPVSIKYITTSEGVENTHFLEFKNEPKEITEYCHGQHDMITLDIFDTKIKDIIYIEGPGPNEKHCYERTSFLRMLENTAWITYSHDTFTHFIKIFKNVLSITSEYAFASQYQLKNLDKFFNTIVSKKYENIESDDNETKRKTVFYPEIIKNIYDVYRLFKNEFSNYIPHEGLLMVERNPNIKNFVMVPFHTAQNDFYSVQTNWSGVSVAHEKELFMIYPKTYTGHKLQLKDLNMFSHDGYNQIFQNGIYNFIQNNY